MSRVKICGITNLADAVAAVDAGADALGFNFYEQSPRFVSIAQAAEIVDRLPRDHMNVGVFVNADLETIIATARKARLDAVQLHGDESPGFVDRLRNEIDALLIKAFRVSHEFDTDRVREYAVDGVLLDGYSTNARGGTGQTFDWTLATLIGKHVEKVWLAGGLTPDNVRLAIKTVRPFAVDACSSLESVPGIKDPAKVEQFITEAKAA